MQKYKVEKGGKVQAIKTEGRFFFCNKFYNPIKSSFIISEILKNIPAFFKFTSYKSAQSVPTA